MFIFDVSYFLKYNYINYIKNIYMYEYVIGIVIFMFVLTYVCGMCPRKIVIRKQ